MPCEQTVILFMMFKIVKKSSPPVKQLANHRCYGADGVIQLKTRVRTAPLLSEWSHYRPNGVRLLGDTTLHDIPYILTINTGIAAVIVTSVVSL